MICGVAIDDQHSILKLSRLRQLGLISLFLEYLFLFFRLSKRICGRILNNKEYYEQLFSKTFKTKRNIYISGKGQKDQNWHKGHQKIGIEQ